MADNLIQKLNTLANAINSKAGTTGSMTIDEMTTKVNNISAGEDVTDETDTYTDLLDELEGAVNDLPEAGSGGGGSGGSSGASIETVTLIVEKGEAPWHSPYDEPYVHYTTVESGVITYKKLKTPLNSTHVLTVVKNSLVLATNAYDAAVADSEWDMDRTLTGGMSDDVWASGSSKFVAVYWANQDFTLWMD